MSVSSAINIAHLRELARRRLPRVVFDFLEGGAEDETTLDWNREAFQRCGRSSRASCPAPRASICRSSCSASG